MKMASVVVLCVALCMAVCGGSILLAAEQQSSETLLTSDEALILRLVNEERRERGLGALELDPVLIKVARDHSRDMERRGYFGHISPGPEPTTPLDRYASALGRHPETVVGENVGRAPEPVMGLVHLHMMESPEHRANILDAEYTRVGVGIYALEDGRVWLTEMFGGPAPSDAPTSEG